MVRHELTDPDHAIRHHFVQHPVGWRVVGARRPLGFVTRVVYETPDGAHLEWTSRRHRKGLGLRPLGPAWAGVEHRERLADEARRPNLWIGLLFMIGASAFALASLPWVATHADAGALATTFFVGSVFFTSAALLQHIQTLRADRAVGGAVPRRVGHARLVIEARRLDWWVTAVQLVGTLFFNLSTFAAMNDALDGRQEELLVWLPDVGGSAAFLVSSYLAVMEVCHGRWCLQPRDISWRICAINLLGSIAFGVSAAGAFVVPSTGEVLSAELVNAFTFLGAACFAVGAYLLLPESRLGRSGPAARPQTLRAA